jgi:hypothetical protein
MKRRPRLRRLVAAAAAALSFASPAQDQVDPGRFSGLLAGAPIPAPWSPLLFRNIERHTRYSVVVEDGASVVKAEAERSASGLISRFDQRTVDLKEFPVLRWRWKIAGLVKGADIGAKSGDDYPARVYVTFRYDPERAGAGMRLQYGMARALHGEYPPHAALNYVWDGKAPAGTMVPNAYTARAMMVVVESGALRVGQWVEVERNVYEDYKRAFHEEPPPVSGIALMTDTDQTGESATAWYGDISLRRARQAPLTTDSIQRRGMPSTVVHSHGLACRARACQSAIAVARPRVTATSSAPASSNSRRNEGSVKRTGLPSGGVRVCAATSRVKCAPSPACAASACTTDSSSTRGSMWLRKQLSWKMRPKPGAITHTMPKALSMVAAVSRELPQAKLGPAIRKRAWRNGARLSTKSGFSRPSGR